jgi:hypothetical protein
MVASFQVAPMQTPRTQTNAGRGVLKRFKINICQYLGYYQF